MLRHPHRVIPAKAGTSVGDRKKGNGGSRLRGNDAVGLNTTEDADAVPQSFQPENRVAILPV
jgi:hypothetical protein